jgi:hypothetical protein
MGDELDKSVKAELLHLIEEANQELALNILNVCLPLATAVEVSPGQPGSNVVAFPVKSSDDKFAVARRCADDVSGQGEVAGHPVKSNPDHSEFIVFLDLIERRRELDISVVVVSELPGDVITL